MKTVHIVTRHGNFKVLVAVKGKRNSTPKELKHALEVAVHRIARAERRFTILRVRRAKDARRTKRGGKR